MRHTTPSPQPLLFSFPTPLGQAAMAASKLGLCRLWLPGSQQIPPSTGFYGLSSTGADSYLPTVPAPEADIQLLLRESLEGIATRIAAHLGGELSFFTDIPLDLTHVGPFQQEVYTWLRFNVLPGKTITYGELASALRRPGAARAVARAMACNPVPLIVPCHRVVAAGGKLGGFSGGHGLATKEALLTLEGAGKRGIESLHNR